MYKSISTRALIVEQKLSGKTLVAISDEQSIAYSTVRRIWKRYQQGGFENLKPRYENCGSKVPKHYRMYRRSIWLKRHHPDWGAPYILTLIRQKYPQATCPTARTVQKWFKSKNLNPPKIQREQQVIEPVKEVHDCWQIDAKENIKLTNGKRACYLTTVDVKSGAVLEAPIFSLWKNQSSSSVSYPKLPCRML